MLWTGVIERYQRVSATPTDALVWVEEEGESSAWAAPTAPPAQEYAYAEKRRDGREREQFLSTDAETCCCLMGGYTRRRLEEA